MSQPDIISIAHRFRFVKGIPGVSLSSGEGVRLSLLSLLGVKGKEGARSRVKGAEDGWRRTEGGKGEFKIPVFIDSPLGLEITRLYSALDEFWDKEAKELKAKGDHPIDFEHLYAVRDHSAHLKLCNMDSPAIIVAGSGMCTGGRIVAHLKNGLSDKRNDILFVVGGQAFLIVVIAGQG